MTTHKSQFDFTKIDKVKNAIFLIQKEINENKKQYERFSGNCIDPMTGEYRQEALELNNKINLLSSFLIYPTQLVKQNYVSQEELIEYENYQKYLKTLIVEKITKKLLTSFSNEQEFGIHIQKDIETLIISMVKKSIQF